MIHYIQPYTTDKNIGGCYNREISFFPDTDWICLLDHDAMFLRPDSKAQIQHIVETKGNEWSLLGVMTNRLAGSHQLYDGKFNEGTDILEHISKADQLNNDHYGEVSETVHSIAGLCMLFKKSTWRSAGKFNEYSIYLDKEFTNHVRFTGGRIGIMKGVYMFHLYRMGQVNPTEYTKHLL